MYVVLGATGHVGSACAEALLAAGEAVTVVTRDAANAADLAGRGATVAQVDVRDVAALAGVLRGGRRALLVNPPADPATDVDVAERETVAAIVAAVAQSGLEGVVALSTYGARPGRGIFDLGVLWDLEQALVRQPVPATVLRAAYLMSNWDAQVDAARAGAVTSLLPAADPLPMVAPADVGAAAARLLRAGAWRRVEAVEGPARYAPTDVAAAFAAALGRAVAVRAVPRGEWETAMEALGFSAAAARSFAGMTAITAAGEVDPPPNPIRGPTTLDVHVAALVG